MRGARWAVCLAVGAVAMLAQPGLPKEEYRARRAELRKSLADGVVALFGRAEKKDPDDTFSAFRQDPSFFYLTGWEGPGAILLLWPPGGEAASRLGELAGSGEPADARPAIDGLRMRKSAREVELIERAIDVTIAAQRAAWQRVRPGVFEYQVAATLTGTMLEHGCRGGAFGPITASGPNAPRQNELYDIVLGPQRAVIAAIRPGIEPGAARDAPNSLYKVAYDYIDGHGKDRAGNSLGKCLVHGVSHHVGLQAHDPGPPGQKLEPGMVVTVEPGIYIPEEGIGIRIEDMVLVTEKGARVLSAALPKDPAAVEKAMGR